MMIISILIFCIVLFLYLHIYFHLKQSNDLEVYEIDRPSKQRLEEVCDIRQPTTFYYSNEQLLYLASYKTIYNNYKNFDIKIRDVSNLNSKIHESNDEYDSHELYIPLTLSVAHEAFKADKNSKYLSENNTEFIEETGILKLFELNDELLKPYMVSNCSYDIMLSSRNTHTPLRYEVNYRNYFLVTQGCANILLIPPKYSKYLYPIDDYTNFEFISPVNPWNVQVEYKSEYKKLKSLNVELTVGMMIYIPAYWWYSIKFIDCDTSICAFRYRTYMNTVSILPKLCMKMLQINNIKIETLKTNTSIKSESSTNPTKSNDTTIESTYKTDVESTNVTQNKQASNYNIGDVINGNDVLKSTHLQGIKNHGDEFLPESLRNMSNPFTIMNSEAVEIRTDASSVISAALSNTTNNDSTLSATSISIYKPEQNEVILMNDAINDKPNTI